MTYRLYDTPLGLVLDTGPESRVLPIHSVVAKFAESVTNDRPGVTPRFWLLITAKDTNVMTREHGIKTGAALDDLYFSNSQPLAHA